MNNPPLLVLERRSRWAPILRRELGEWADRVGELRIVEQVRGELAPQEPCFLVVELTSNGLEKQLQLLLDLVCDHESVCTVSVGDEKYAKLASEAGAVAHFTGLHQWESLVALARRYLSQHRTESATESDGDLRSNWRARLDWPAPIGTPAVLPATEEEENE